MQENRSLGFPTRSDTNLPVQQQKMARNLKFQKKRNGTIHVVNTKALISCAVTAQLIRAFVFASAIILFPRDTTHMSQVMSNMDFCICENKSADQLCSNSTADQHHCFFFFFFFFFFALWIVQFVFYLYLEFQAPSLLL